MSYEVTKRKLQRHYLNWKDCKSCELHRHRKQVVLYRFSDIVTMNHSVERNRSCTDVCFIGEAPGAAENIIGVPFVPNAPAGANLELIVEQVYTDYKQFSWAITNVVACHPTGNRNPTTEECTACAPRLIEFLALVQPRLVVLVGSVTKSQFDPDKTLKLLRYEGYTDADFHTCTIVHPAAIARKVTAGDPSAQKQMLDAASMIMGSLKHVESSIPRKAW